MKTVGDVSAFVKRSGLRLEISHDGKQFTVKTGGYTQRSKHLDDALEHLSEEMRRDASGVGSVRNGSFTQVQTAPQATLQQAVQNICNATGKGAVSLQATASCGTVTAIDGVCPDCNRLAYLWSATEFYCIVCTTGKTWSPTIGSVYAIVSAKYRYEGPTAFNKWTPVP